MSNESGVKPGVCPACGYAINPNKEEVKPLDGWDFAHERCFSGGD